MEWTIRLPKAAASPPATSTTATATATTTAAATGEDCPSETTTTTTGGYILGVDEAGRGPVLGPMVYACAFWRVEDDEAMRRKGFDDSKKLSEAQRERLFAGIKAEEGMGFVSVVVSAEFISQRMLRPDPVSLNRIAHDVTREMLARVVDAGVDVREIYVDAVGNCETYERWLGSCFPRAKVKVSAKADSLFPTVSAASIVAKVARDACLRDWVFAEPGLSASATNKAWGCGYPGDEQTKKWLADNVDPVFGFPSVVRHSWQTIKTILEGPPGGSSESSSSLSKKRAREDDDNNEDDGEADGTGAAPQPPASSTTAKGVPVLFPCDVTRGSHSIASMFARAQNKRVAFVSSRGIESVSFSDCFR